MIMIFKGSESHRRDPGISGHTGGEPVPWEYGCLWRSYLYGRKLFKSQYGKEYF